MTTQTHGRNQIAFLTKPLFFLGGAAFLIVLFTFVRVLASWQGDTQWSWMALLLPWLAIAIAAFAAVRAKTTLGLALIAGATVLAAYLGVQNLTRHLAPFDRWGRVLEDGPGQFRRDADLVILNAVSFLDALALILLVVATVGVILKMRTLLLGPVPRASFGIDITLLITAFAFVALTNPMGYQNNVGDAYTLMLTLSWLVPTVVALALFVRQGGALAVGATVGLLVGTSILPWVTERIDDLSSDRSVMLSVMTTRPEYLVSIPLALLLVVTTWWALSRSVGGNPHLVVANSSSPINSTSIVAFSLAWLPLTSIPAVVFGHMAYDQIVDGEKTQRGLGLARWAIVFAYLTLLGGGFFIFNQLT